MRNVSLFIMLAIGAAAFGATSPAATDTLTAATHAGMTADETKTADLQQSHKILYIGEGQRAPLDSVSRAIALFYADQFQHFQDPLAPYFMLMSKDARLAMGIGGSVRMRAWSDFGGSVPVNGFMPYFIPVPKDRDKQRRIGGTPGGTALFFKVIGRNNAFGNIVGYIQCDFSGHDNVTFKLKKAYVTINDWTIGLASTTFSDPAAEAPTIDGAGQNGRTSRSSMLVRWMHGFDPHWSMAASMELPSSNVDADGVNAKRLDDYLPDIAAFGQYQWDHAQHIRLSGLVRAIPYRNLLNGKAKTVIGWGLQLSTVVYPLNTLALYGEFNAGRGYASYIGDLSAGNYDLVSDPASPGELYAPTAMGLNIGAKYSFSNKVYASTALGEVRYFPRHKTDPTDYRYGLYGSVALFYEPTSRIQAGIEYLTGARHNFNGMHASANRIDILFQFAF